MDIEILGSAAWQRWTSDGTLTPQSKGHYMIADDEGDERALCGVKLPGAFEVEWEGGAYVDCRACQKKAERIS